MLGMAEGASCVKFLSSKDGLVVGAGIGVGIVVVEAMPAGSDGLWVGCADT